MSANDYMETVTGFSASLLQSLGGDTQKAAEKADKALVQMSDNSAKMGSDMESIKYAYQGFAKQNYTINYLMSAAEQACRKSGWTLAKVYITQK